LVWQWRRRKPRRLSGALLLLTPWSEAATKESTQHLGHLGKAESSHLRISRVVCRWSIHLRLDKLLLMLRLLLLL
jgi:hypothetical protein